MSVANTVQSNPAGRLRRSLRLEALFRTIKGKERGTPYAGRMRRTLLRFINTLYEGAYRMRTNFQQTAEETGAGDAERRGRVDRAGAWEASEQGTIALIRRWKAELAGKKVPFDLVIIDRPGRVYNKFELRFIENLRATCAQDQIDCLRLKLDGDPYELYSFDGIALGHFNDKGHETVANELYEFFQSHHKAMISRPATPGIVGEKGFCKTPRPLPG